MQLWISTTYPWGLNAWKLENAFIEFWSPEIVLSWSVNLNRTCKYCFLSSCVSVHVCVQLEKKATEMKKKKQLCKLWTVCWHSGKVHRPFPSCLFPLCKPMEMCSTYMGPGKPGKSWNFILAFSWKCWKKAAGPGKLWKSVK